MHLIFTSTAKNKLVSMLDELASMGVLEAVEQNLNIRSEKDLIDQQVY